MSKTVEPRYLEQFRCRKGECDDTCCSGKEWRISHDDHRRLKVVLGESAAAQATLRDGSVLLRRDKSENCFFLRQDHLCTIVASYGEAALPTPCATYPKKTHLVGDHLERVGTLACPEIARLCLLADGLSSESALGRHEVSFAVDARVLVELGEESRMGPYFGEFELVRDALLGILSNEDKSIEARLEALVNVAERVSSYFNEHTESFDDVALRARLRADFEGAFAPRSRRGGAGLDDLMAVRVGAYFLDEHRVERSTRLGRLIEKIRRKYERKLERHMVQALDDGEALAACDIRTPRFSEGKSGRRDAESLLRMYRARRALMRLGHSRRLEQYFTNYCLNYALVERYVDWPSLRDYARDLALCLAALRFLLFSHPGICIPWEGDEGAESREVEGEGWSTGAVDSAAVETFQALTRAIEQTNLLAELRRATRIDDTPGATGLIGLVSS